MDFEELCEKLTGAKHLDATKKAIVILWWINKENHDKSMTVNALAQLLLKHRLGNPNQKVLGKNLAVSPLTLKNGHGFVLRAGAGETIASWLKDLPGVSLPTVEHKAGFLPQAVWDHTRGYIEKVCTQLNGCYHYGFYDGAAVMVRRLIETLIIESYEQRNQQGNIQDANGNYFMLGDLIAIALGSKGLGLGREAKSALQEIKKLGDRSAHNRRFNAVKHDLDLVQSGTRVSAEELINIAALRHK